MTLTPTQKQALSGLAVVLAGSLLTWANASLNLLPEGWQGLAGAVLAGIAHYLPALGTADKIEAKANVKAADKLAAIIERDQS
jgi:hypothetical protein